jgi:hypothetical protein
LRSGTLQRQALAQTAQETKEEALRQAAKVVGSDLIMRNYPRGKLSKPRKIGFGYELHGDTKATLNFRPGGMWRIIEDGTSQHTIGGQGRIVNRGKRGGYRRIGVGKETAVFAIDGKVRSGVRHVRGAKPQGSPGKKTIKTIPKHWDDAFALQFNKRIG